MEERQQKPAGTGGLLRSAAPFLLGLVAALAVGWLVFPQLLFSKQEQPVAFKHSTHIDATGDCATCHFLRKDGSFAGLPGNETCANCHTEEPLGESQAEKDFIENYLKPGKEVPWLAHQRQPDNVFFSHAVHSLQTCQPCHGDLFKTEADLCMRCHPSVEELDKIAHEANRLTGYSKRIMKMDQCESCHAVPEHYYEGGATKANNACFTCHK